MRTIPLRRAWWPGVALALALGLSLAAALDRGSAPAHAQAEGAGGGFTLSVQQLRINQRISQAAVRRSNRALEGLEEMGSGGQVAGPEGAAGPAGPAGPPGERGERGPSSAAAWTSAAGGFHPLPRSATDPDRGEEVEVGAIALGAGAHVVTAHAVLVNDLDGRSLGVCELRAGADVLMGTEIGLGNDTGMVVRAPVTLTGAVRLEEAGEVALVCRIDHQEDHPGIPRVRHATRVALTAVSVDDVTIEAESPEAT